MTASGIKSLLTCHLREAPADMPLSPQVPFFFFFSWAAPGLFFFFLIIYLAVLGLSCDTWDLQSFCGMLDLVP